MPSGPWPAMVKGCHCQRDMLGKSRYTSRSGQAEMPCGTDGRKLTLKSKLQRGRVLLCRRRGLRLETLASARATNGPQRAAIGHSCTRQHSRKYRPEGAAHLPSLQLQGGQLAAGLDVRCCDGGHVGQLAAAQHEVDGVQEEACKAAAVATAYALG